MMSDSSPSSIEPECSATDPVALVTGSAKRVGRAIALTLAQAGYDLALHYHQSEREAETLAGQIASLGRRVVTIGADLAQPRSPHKIFQTVRDTFGRLDALINNASIFAPGPIGSITAEVIQLNHQVNAVAPLMLIQLFRPLLEARYDPRNPASTGRVVNFIDIHVMGQPLAGYLPYNLSKAALQEITQTAAVELAPRITVNAIAPGVVAWADSYTPQMKSRYMSRVPLGRPGTPQDAAEAVLFLVRDAHYCTGQTIRLDGGRSLT